MGSQFDEGITSKGKRSWQCFICGVQHEDYEIYSKHIKDEHEEGREYISCPACDAPVRDMRAHYNMKHPARPLPTNVQLRAAVWKDFTTQGKKTKSKKPGFREGNFVSQKMNGAEIHYRSGKECEIYELLEMDKDVVAYYAEPFKVPYCHNGEWHNYIPDIKLQYADGRVEIWEFKPANQTGYQKNKAKWAAMNEYAKVMGWDFTVITEVGIGKLKSRVKNQQLPQ